MSKIVKAKVIQGRYLGEVVRITNVSVSTEGKKSAACFLANGNRVNIPVSELEIIQEVAPEVIPERRPGASMPFMSGSTGSRSMTQTKSLVKKRNETAKASSTKNVSLVMCEKCGQEFNQEARKGRPGKLTECEDCALETETKMEGTMVFSHKTGATIEIKKDGELKHEAEIFDPKNKT